MDQPVYTNRRLLHATGADTVSFLHKLTSQDLMPLAGAAQGTARYTLLLSPQGRYLYDFFAIADGADGLWIDCAADQAEALMAALNKYKLRSAVTFESVVPGTAFSFTDPRDSRLGERTWAVDNRGAAVTLGHDYWAALTRLGMVEPSVEMTSGQDVPLDFGLHKTRAIAFDKGCFTGQELTARTMHRNLIKYDVFAHPVVPGVAVGTPVLDASGADVGRVLRVADDMMLVQAKRAALSANAVTILGATITPPTPAEEALLTS